MHTTAPVIPLVLLALILGLPGVLIVITAHRLSYVFWMCVYLLSLPIWNLILPSYAYWHFDDFSWGDTRKMAGEKKGAGKSGHEASGEFDSSKITMKRWGDFEQERRLRAPAWASQGAPTQFSGSGAGGFTQSPTEYSGGRSYRKHERMPSNLAYEESYSDYP
jgi:chitin synthase